MANSHFYENLWLVNDGNGFLSDTTTDLTLKITRAMDLRTVTRKEGWDDGKACVCRCFVKAPSILYIPRHQTQLMTLDPALWNVIPVIQTGHGRQTATSQTFFKVVLSYFDESLLPLTRGSLVANGTGRKLWLPRGLPGPARLFGHNQPPWEKEELPRLIKLKYSSSTQWGSDLWLIYNSAPHGVSPFQDAATAEMVRHAPAPPELTVSFCL